MTLRSVKVTLAAAGLALASPAAAESNHLELWLNPAITTDIDDRTFVELESAQRFRESPVNDTYYARLWLGREVANGVTVSAGIERRHEGDGRETRLLQQVGYPLGGIFKGRTRVEQRFIEGDARTGWRLRQRLGLGVPLSNADKAWEFAANAEGFFTLRGSEPGDDTGLTGLRTFVGVEREFDRVELSLGYLRQQNIRRNAPDRVGHAPFVGLTFKL